MYQFERVVISSLESIIHARMIFVFVDDTGDPGRRNILSIGSTPYFGLTAISVLDKEYETIRYLLSQVHWLRGIASTITLPRMYGKAMNLMRGLKSLANYGIISSSCIYINKDEYGGKCM